MTRPIEENESTRGPGPQIRIDESFSQIPQQFMESTIATQQDTKPDKTHLLNNATSIEEAALVAQRRGAADNALLLGVGKCEFNLEKIVRGFKHVRLVDIDTKGIKKAVSKLDPDLQEKCEIITADLSGVIGEVSEKLLAIDPSSPEAFLQQAAAIIGDTNPKDKPPSFGEHDFVASQLLMTELPLILTDDILPNLFEHCFPDTTFQFDRATLAALKKFKNLLFREHIRFTARSTRPDGLFYFADTDAEYINERDGVPIFEWERIQPVLKANFHTIIEPITWDWQMSEDQKFRVAAQGYIRVPDKF